MAACTRCAAPVKLQALQISSCPVSLLPRMSRPHVSCAASESPGLVYSVSAGLDHDWPMHNENARRVISITEELAKCGLLDDERIRELPYTPASRDSIKLVHTPAYVDGLAKVVETQAPVEVEESGPTYVTTASYDTVLKSVGAALALVDEVVEQSKGGTPDTAFALVRPPGHHAVPGSPMGFCIFNTATVAARHAQAAHGLRRVAVFDFDVHHGNGTDDAFAADDSVLYVSAHQAGSYPGTGKMAGVGRGAGEGFTMNVELPGDAGDAAYRALWEEAVLPRLDAFAPDIIIVSAGYDAHWRDPLAGLQLRTSTFHWLSAQLRAAADRLCGGRVVFVLEGGYDLKALGDSVCDSMRGTLGLASADKFNPQLLREEPLDKVRQALAEARSIHGL